MKKTRHLLPRRALLVVLALTLAIPGWAATLEGRWKLVEQTYGKGQANLVRTDSETFVLEFARNGIALDGRIRSGDGGEAVFAWPRLSNDSRRVHVDERSFSGGEDEVVVRYRVEPSAGDDLTLHVTERYRLAEAGRVLDGDVEIVFHRDGKRHGSYTLHRRFERMP